MLAKGPQCTSTGALSRPAQHLTSKDRALAHTEGLFHRGLELIAVDAGERLLVGNGVGLEQRVERGACYPVLSNVELHVRNVVGSTEFEQLVRVWLFRVQVSGFGDSKGGLQGSYIQYGSDPEPAQEVKVFAVRIPTAVYTGANHGEIERWDIHWVLPSGLL